MNNGNSSKQVLLSVVGIAILVIAVVGVSFAFFTYSKTGDNQLLTTGTIFFQFTDGDSISLKDQFPTPDETGAGFALADHGQDGESYVAREGAVMTFTVVGHDSSGKGIDYTITAVKGEAPSKETLSEEFDRTPLKDDEVKIYIKQVSTDGGGEKAKAFEPVFGDGTTGGGVEQTKTYKHVSESLPTYDSVAEVSPNAALEAGVLLGTGHITATSSGAQQTDKYEVRMWIASDCKIGDSTDDDYTSADFAKKYYSIKIKIDAKTAVE